MSSRISSFENLECIDNIKNIYNESINHLKDVDMNYIEHLKFSCSISFQFLIAAQKALIHALIPGIFITSSTPSTILKQLFLSDMSKTLFSASPVARCLERSYPLIAR